MCLFLIVFVDFVCFCFVDVLIITNSFQCLSGC